MATFANQELYLSNITRLLKWEFCLQGGSRCNFIYWGRRPYIELLWRRPGALQRQWKRKYTHHQGWSKFSEIRQKWCQVFLNNITNFLSGNSGS
jgi:hypothetical protein